MGDDTALAEHARAAIGRGEWQRARELLDSAQRERALSPGQLELLAQAAYGAGDLETTLTAWEQAHRQLSAAGHTGEAARAAVMVALHLMMDTGLMAPVRGWLATAQRLLAGTGEAAVHAWLAMVACYERLMCGDMPAADRWAQQAIEIGARQSAPAPVAMGRTASARVRIFDGDVETGLALLDEAAVATVAGELEPLVVGMVYCEVICAMQGLAQYDRADQWTEAMRRWGAEHAVGGIGGRCRVHRAEILRLRGSCAEAEAEALHACEELRPWMRREFGWPLTELGTIRLRKGDLAGAEEALLAAHAHGWDPHPALARLRLAQGQVTTAHSLIADALSHPRRTPSKEHPPGTALARAPLLDAQIEIAVAAGDVVTAAQAAEELTEIAGVYGSTALAAAATLGRGRVALAHDDPQGAVAACEDALGLWSEIGAPYETAVVRMTLAQAQRAHGNEERARLELDVAGSTFEELGAGLKAREAHAARQQTVATSPSPVATTTAEFRLEGNTRRIHFAGRGLQLSDLKGMRYLARLLADPGRELHVLDLVATEQGVMPTPAHAVDDELAITRHDDLGPALDRQATQAYKQRLVEIEDDLDEAQRSGDAERAALAAADRDYLIAELSRAFGLGGRARPTGSSSERARTSVTRAVRYALARIEHHHPALGAHLAHAVRTGTYCCYTPDPAAPVDWRL